MSIFRADPSKSFAHTNPISTFLMVSVIFAYFLTSINDDLFYLFALNGLRVIDNGEYWRVVSVWFVHGNLLHLLGNVFFGIFIFGAALERILGWKKYAVVFFASGLFASFAIVVLDYIQDSPVPTVGISGAVFGVLGAFLYLILRRSHWFTESDISGIKGLIFINVIFSLAPGISAPGHFGGLIAGYLLAAILPIGQDRRRKKGFGDPYGDPYIDPASLDELDDVEEVDDDDDDDPFSKYDKDFYDY